MSRILGYLLGGILIIIGGLGFIYFGPPQITKHITRTQFFKNFLGPKLDKIFLIDQSNSFSIGHLDETEGDLTYRPSSELVFLPAREGQRLFGGTLVSTGPNSKGTITLIDDSELVLEENSTILLEIPEDFEISGAMDLQVLSGSVSAERKQEGTAAAKSIKVNLVNTAGQRQELKREKLVIVAKDQIAQPKQEEIAKDEPVIASNLQGIPTAGAAQAAPPSELSLESIQSNLSVDQLGPLSLDSGESSALSTGELGLNEENREPASIPEIQPDWPTAIEPRLVKKREPKRVIRIRQFDPPPEESDLARAIFALNQGKRSLSQRYLARALTRKDYYTGTLNPATRIALEGVLENYLAAKDCELASYFFANAERAFSQNESGSSWIKLQKVRLIRQCSSQK